MKNLPNLPFIFAAVVEELKTSVTYNHYYATKHLLLNGDLQDLFEQYENIPETKLLDLYLKGLKDKLGNDYDEVLFTDIYKTAFINKRRSQNSLHIRCSSNQQNSSSTPLDIYIDVNQIVNKMADKNNTVQRRHLLEVSSIYSPQSSINQFSTTESGKIIFKYEVQPGYDFNCESNNKKIETSDYNFLIKIGAGLSLGAGLITITLACVGIVSMIAPLIIGIGLVGFSAFLFFGCIKERPPEVAIPVENLPEPKILDIQQAFSKLYKISEIEVIHEDGNCSDEEVPQTFSLT